jgi:hypothetical protein
MEMRMVPRKGRRPETEKQTREVPARDSISPDPSRVPQPETGATRQDNAHPANELDSTGQQQGFGPFEETEIKDRDFISRLVGQLFRASARGDDKYDDDALFFPLAVIKDKKPRDTLDAMHLAQMSAVHLPLMKIAGQHARAETVYELEYAGRMLNQLARTYSAQLEAFNRYHGGTDQKVTVQNVSVAEGGQAIVGNVTQAAARAAPEEAGKAKPALTDARQVPMEIIGESKQMPAPIRANSKALGSSDPHTESN